MSEETKNEIAVEETPKKLARGLPFKKGQKPGPGRPKGLQNKVNQNIREMILTALDKAGGAKYLENCANDPKTKTAFLGLVGKILPMQITGENGGALQHAIRVEFIKPTE